MLREQAVRSEECVASESVVRKGTVVRGYKAYRSHHGAVGLKIVIPANKAKQPHPFNLVSLDATQAPEKKPCLDPLR